MDSAGRKGIITNHSHGKAHTEAMMSWKEYQMRAKAGSSIGMQLDQMGTQVINQNRAYVAALMDGIPFCSQQGIAILDHDEGDDSLNPGNFKAFMNLLPRDSKPVETRLAGFTLASELNARTLAEYIFQKISDFELDLGNFVSQCYVGASVMSECNTGVQTIIKEKCPQAMYIHCSAHRLNLVLVDASKQVKAASNFLAHMQPLYVFFSASKCHELFLSIQR